ncbi:MAG: T9SS type A sorting domain-containing protein, partial [Psychromonas sp.]|nr:T9SS type A sorting domain-containing protein [Psychromonas sp.]
VTVEILNQPDEYSISQNYPNPFNPATTIQYSIPENGNVALKIFNALGKEVANLVNEFQQPGIYKVNFNGENLGSGVYYYRLESGRFSQTNKMILLR